MPSPISSPTIPHTTGLKQTDSEAAVGTPSAEQPPSNKRQRDPSESPEIYITGRRNKHPSLRRSPSNPGSSSATSKQAEEAERFREEVAAHCAELRRTDSDVSGSPHSRLAAAVGAMFEFDSPALKEAVVSTLSDPDPQKAISPDQFFATNLLNGATTTPFDDALEAIDSAFRAGDVTSGAERLIKDVQTFHALVDACQASPHEKIRAAPSAYIAKATAAFVRQALALTSEQQVPDAEMLQSLLEHLETNPDTDAALDVLGCACEGQFSAEIRMALHGFALSIAAHLPDSIYKSGLIASFTAAVPGLPIDHQLHVFRNCVRLDKNTPVEAARRLLHSCAGALDQFNHEVGGKAAIELVKAAGQYGNPEALTSLMYAIEDKLIRRNPYSNGGKSYFDSVPENDRIEFFVSMMHAVLTMPGFNGRDAATRGLQIVDRVLPEGMVAPAKDALWEVDRGNNVDFRSEVHRW